MMHKDKIIIQDFQLQVVIGAHKPERTIKQNLFFTITLFTGITAVNRSLLSENHITKFRYTTSKLLSNDCDTKDISKCAETDNVVHTVDYGHVTKAIAAYADRSRHFTIEALAVGVARICCVGFGVEEVIVRYDFTSHNP